MQNFYSEWLTERSKEHIIIVVKHYFPEELNRGGPVHDIKCAGLFRLVSQHGEKLPPGLDERFRVCYNTLVQQRRTPFVLTCRECPRQVNTRKQGFCPDFCVLSADEGLSALFIIYSGSAGFSGGAQQVLEVLEH